MSKSAKSKNHPSSQLSHSNSPQKKSLLVSHYQGPVPPPEVLERLNKVLPGAAERIFLMAEREQEAIIEDRKHSQEREDRIVENKHVENMTALIMAFCVCVIFCVAGTLLIIKGFEKAGLALLGTTLVGVVSSFLYNARKKKDN